MIKLERKIHKIDATKQILGRLASQIAKILMGKNKPQYQPNLDLGDFVHIVNAANIITSGKKLSQKKYFHFSGYPGGLKEKKMSEVMAKNPADALKRAVWNMLPKNKTRVKMFKRLIIKN
ncbi:MAG: 50S ribosomal protein L13 [Candidatus Buchananbacteria bacterium RIFCSPHIGHO2_01_FULL_39_14]|uniref:Large ribosomal subunit protein uL13 n=2 Tax=Candidatus Buchananiibacteriota TaxID=1817903 RepID=A0A1G1YSX8_9BACT|nr:MAG: 50S ribosomal protein L13 [Candidatus Buchananbacteria bacterium RIFCSPHIGHO2_01_FULL_39_14]OGY48879.1 MAG: 50S ribosomal protein L13 [Candidatus Buchananbacteria bacterium RIFCSPHIGHO2_02_FULL_39_17]OGY55441.1 MAG: 50S ribosomal protein L13 [Candidatus Buchananbacteria bacterium RIFCSPLOWO2_01_FULL_40_23b]